MSESGAAGIDEREVIRRVLSGEKEEFRHLVRAHQDRIFAMIMRQVGDRALAGDLAQEVMIRAYLGLDRFRFECSFSTWTTRIALNVAATYFSSRQFRQRSRTVALEAARADEIPEPRPREAQTLDRLRVCIGALRPKYREVLALCALERRSYAEAAAVLGVPEGTVCSRLRTARAPLRKRLTRRALWHGIQAKSS